VCLPLRANLCCNGSPRTLCPCFWGPQQRPREALWAAFEAAGGGGGRRGGGAGGGCALLDAGADVSVFERRSKEEMLSGGCLW
jgi:hypothetical protein